MLYMPICYLCKFNSDSDSRYRFFLCEWNVSISAPLTKRWKVKTFSFHRQRKLRLGLSSTLPAPFIHAFILRKKKKEETFCEHYPSQGWRVSGAYPGNTACKVVRQWFKFLGKLMARRPTWYQHPVPKAQTQAHTSTTCWATVLCTLLSLVDLSLSVCFYPIFQFIFLYFTKASITSVIIPGPQVLDKALMHYC